MKYCISLAKIVSHFCRFKNLNGVVRLNSVLLRQDTLKRTISIIVKYNNLKAYTQGRINHD
jgi:hypothetical protein